MKSAKCFGLLLTLLIWSNFILGQTSDAELWSGISIRKKITRKVSVNIEEQVRINNNISSVKSVFSDLSVLYRFNKSFRLSGNYRYINRGSNTGINRVAHRFYADMRILFKANPLIFIYRNRFSTENAIKTNGNGYKRENYERNKLEVKFDIHKRFNPYVASELYYYLGKSEFRKVRYTAGIDLDLKNRNELSLFYRIQREFNVKNPEYSYIIGVGFSHNLKGRLIKNKTNSQEGVE